MERLPVTLDYAFTENGFSTPTITGQLMLQFSSPTGGVVSGEWHFHGVRISERHPLGEGQIASGLLISNRLWVYLTLGFDAERFRLVGELACGQNSGECTQFYFEGETWSQGCAFSSCWGRPIGTFNAQWATPATLEPPLAGEGDP